MPPLLAPTLLGLAVIITTVVLLLRNKAHPIVAMGLVPTLGALAAGFGIAEISDFYLAGLDRVMEVVVMFIFAIIFFGVLSDVGLFDPLIRALIISTRGNVLLVALGTAAISVVAHLDGSGSTTFLLTIPALLPLYRAMHMSRYILLAIVALSASVMNMVPWAGPLGRAATVTNQAASDLWRHLLPAQGVALVLVFAIAGLLGWSEKRRLAKLTTQADYEGPDNVNVRAIAEDFIRRQREDRAERNSQVREGAWVMWFNVALTVALVGILVGGVVSPGPAFLVATSILLMVNFASVEDQSETLKRHAPAALSMAGVILAAAMFLGVLDGAGMLESIALSLIAILPEAVGPYVHLIVGLLGVPLDLGTSTDAYYFSLLPIVQETAGVYGVSATGTASAMIIGNVIGTFVSPFSPALWLGVGLAGANMGKHIRVTFPIAWGFSVILVLAAWGIGLLV